MENTIGDILGDLADKTPTEAVQPIIDVANNILQQIEQYDMSGWILLIIILTGSGVLFSIFGSILNILISIPQFILSVLMGLVWIVSFPFKYFINKKKSSTTEYFFNDGYKFSRSTPKSNRSKDKSNRSKNSTTIWKKEFKEWTLLVYVNNYILGAWNWFIDLFREKETK